MFVRQGATIRLRAAGHSMTPAIQSGDVLLVEPAPVERLSIGDVVLARAGRHLIAHRIARVGPGPAFLLRDDQTGRDDGWFAAATLLGRVVAVERDGIRRSIPYRPLALLARRQLARLRAGMRALVGSTA